MRVVLLVAIAAALNGCALAGAAMLAQMPTGCEAPGGAGCQQAAYQQAANPPPANLTPSNAAFANPAPANPLASSLLRSQPVQLLHEAAAMFAITGTAMHLGGAPGPTSPGPGSSIPWAPHGLGAQAAQVNQTPLVPLNAAPPRGP